MYTIPLSTLISSLSFDHHLYADNTQLFFSFHPFHFDWSISHLQNALQQISFCMTANLFTLNSSNTEFLLIGLKTNLPKYTTPHLTPPTLLEISTSSLTNILPSLTKFHLQSLLLSHSSTSLYPALPRFLNCLYRCYLYRLLQTWLL